MGCKPCSEVDEAEIAEASTELQTGAEDKSGVGLPAEQPLYAEKPPEDCVPEDLAPATLSPEGVIFEATVKLSQIGFGLRLDTWEGLLQIRGVDPGDFDAWNAVQRLGKNPKLVHTHDFILCVNGAREPEKMALRFMKAESAAVTVAHPLRTAVRIEKQGMRLGLKLHSHPLSTCLQICEILEGAVEQHNARPSCQEDDKVRKGELIERVNATSGLSKELLTELERPGDAVEFVLLRVPPCAESWEFPVDKMGTGAITSEAGKSDLNPRSMLNEAVDDVS